MRKQFAGSLVLGLLLMPSIGFAQKVRVIESPGAEEAFKEAEKLGFDPATVERFWTAWRKDITSANQPEWRPLVESCANDQNTSLRLWGLARLVEAGRQDKIEPYGALMVQMLASLKKGDPDWRDSAFQGPARLPGAGWQIRRDSPFWASFGKLVLSNDDGVVLARLYAIWSWNGSVQDKETIAKLASQIARSTAPAAEASPWDDPRFWMVMDWLCEFGERSDWELITGLWPKEAGLYRAADDIYGNLKEIPAFWGPACSSHEGLPLPKVRPVLHFSFRLVRDEWAKRLNSRGRFEFDVCIGHDGKTSRCRPQPAPWASAATITGARYVSSWVFIYPGIEKNEWPESSSSIASFVLN